jgi:hypothetical protein
MRYTKYKTRFKLVLSADDDLFGNQTDSTYKTTGPSQWSHMYGKTIRFDWNGAFNDVKLSQNCRCVIQA